MISSKPPWFGEFHVCRLLMDVSRSELTGVQRKCEYCPKLGSEPLNRVQNGEANNNFVFFITVIETIGVSSLPLKVKLHPNWDEGVVCLQARNSIISGFLTNTLKARMLSQQAVKVHDCTVYRVLHNGSDNFPSPSVVE
ncbi:hypothetical protein CDAR_565431 [Caerostris darwini]|uniref:Uncharacterized protein n=1 Tax=Caerostris darwini TaxID=1538125 RepID=A0AAV4TX78_9ARAC|nr:hypothetical protein CDAR_565431 [Caerostris darwini]